MTQQPAIPQSASDLATTTEPLTLIDAERLTRQWHALQKRQRRKLPADKLQARFIRELGEAQQRVENKRQNVPEIEFPEALPVSGRREEIAECISKHQVVILAGETGSGKTTQIPKICLTLGRGIKGKIGHTQPRRIAASTVANRIAQELNTPLGSTVGYQVRFTDQTSDQSCIKLMTDGILLAELQNDPLLQQYDTLIIDEAHERSLNIDFLLGYIKRILPKRPDLKVIVTSATIDLDRFSQHFDNAPVLEVSGRTFPVEILYREPADNDAEQSELILEALEEILTLPGNSHGDVLVFLSGEREIRETAHAIRKAQFKHLEVLPLYARLSLAEQSRVFAPHKGRRVVLATNVAETSITVPGIKYVIDPGYARISRYSVRTKVQRLPVEAISQASANQRAGRCGRVSNGVCIRLYSSEDFEARPPFTDAEILRTNLASVVLQMLNMGVGDIRDFPFVDAPDHKLIKDGYKLLEELQAVTRKGQLTSIGKKLSTLPLDPRLGRMLLAAADNGALRELLIIASALAIQDPRERPAEKQQAADEKHRRFTDESSDFASLINLWQYAEQQRQELSQNQWRKQCAKEFLNFMRLREWRELHHQMRLACKQLNLKENTAAADYDAIHKSLLTGLISNVAQKSAEQTDYEYLGTRNRKLSIFPGSGQFKKRPKWFMAAEMLETSRLFAHSVARIEPEWLLQIAKHLLKHHYYEPHYQSKTGQVMGYDRITLMGLVVADKHRVNYSHIDKKIAREVFIRSALVEGAYAKARPAPGAFFKNNQALIEEVEALEAKSRRRDILVNDEIIFQFYDERLPEEAVNLAGFEHWRKQVEQAQPDLLFIPRSLLMQHEAEGITGAQFPDELSVDGMILPLFYHFEPGSADDGVSIGVPVSTLHSLPESRLEWLVPGLLRDKCIALVKALPKQWRRRFVPVPDFVDKALARLAPSNQPLTEALGHELGRLIGQPVPSDIWADVTLDDFYHMNIHVLDDHNKVIERGRNLPALREKYKQRVQKSLQRAGENKEKTQITEWDFGRLEEQTTLDKGAIKVKAYPALVAEKDGIALRMLDNPVDAAQASERGVVSLIAQKIHTTVKYLQKNALKNKDIGLSVTDLGSRADVVQDITYAAIKNTCLVDGHLPRTEQEFAQCLEQTQNVVGKANEYEALLLDILAQVVAIKKAMKTNKNALVMAFTFSDLQQQLNALLYKGFLYHTPPQWLTHYPRFLNAIEQRLQKAPMNIQKDKAAMQVVHKCTAQHQDRLHKEGEAAYRSNPAWQQYRWLIEELRVSLFAQALKTSVPVSEKRLQKLWQESLG